MKQTHNAAWRGMQMIRGSATFDRHDAHSSLVDVLTDLMHWAASAKVDFADAAQIARGHFEVETPKVTR